VRSGSERTVRTYSSIPFPEYIPDGRASASAIARSTVENEPSVRPSGRATPRRWSGSCSALTAYSR
jgi:hypothetical protein